LYCMILLRLITWPYLRKHLLRSVLTILGIVLGIALLVAMRTANQSVLLSFNQTVERIAGKSQLQISAGDIGIPEDVLERVQAVPEVRAAAPVIEAAVDTPFHDEGQLLILAVDMTGDRSLRDYEFDSGDQEVIDDPLVFLAQPDSLIITRELADRHSLATGDEISLDTTQGMRGFIVRGILKGGGMAAAFGGNLAIMDIYAAQQVFGRGRQFNRIDVGLKEGITVEEGTAALRQALGDGFTIEPPSGRGQQFRTLLRIYSLTMNISSVFALFIGMFIIYNSFAIAVTQRRSEIGILRALGASRGQIRSLFLAESACAGLIGSVIGLAIGLAFTRSITGVTGQLLEGVFGIQQNTQEIFIDPGFLLFVVVLGVITSVFAAWIPARNAANVEPIRALQKGKYQVMGAGENRARRGAAVVALAAALLCLALARYRLFFYAGYMALVLGGLLLAPFLSLALSKLLRIPLKWLRPVEGALAADSLIQAPRRTSATVAALMLSVALVIGTGGVAVANYEAIEQWARDALDSDLFVSPSQSLVRHDFRFPASLQRELEQVFGVDEVQPVRTPRVLFRGRPVMLVVSNYAPLANRWRQTPVAGDRRTMYGDVANENGVMVSENLANTVNIRLGDILELNTPNGPLRRPVVGIHRDFEDMGGTIFIERKTYLTFFGDDTVDIFRVYVKPGVSVEEVRSRINTQVGPLHRLFVWQNKEVREYVIGLANQWFGMTYLQVFVAVAVAILGIANTLTVSILDRRRELGILLAVGGTRAQIRGTVWIEALAIAVIALVLGNVIGALNLYYELQAIAYDVSGMSLSYKFPLGIALLLPLVILGAAFAAAILPAESAVRRSLVEALEYE
jgi:putative ABC transport system permease protein